MDLQKAIQQLNEQGQAILALGAGFSLSEARWKPGPENWSFWKCSTTSWTRKSLISDVTLIICCTHPGGPLARQSTHKAG